jgi:hypothetical protein
MDPPKIQTNKQRPTKNTMVPIYSVPLHNFRFVLLLLRQRRGAAGNGMGTTIKYLRQTRGGAAGSGLGSTAKYLR